MREIIFILMGILLGLLITTITRCIIEQFKKQKVMKELLERLLKENEEMINEMDDWNMDTSPYKTGYTQALLNVKNSLEYELGELQI